MDIPENKVQKTRSFSSQLIFTFVAFFITSNILTFYLTRTLNTRLDNESLSGSEPQIINVRPAPTSYYPSYKLHKMIEGKIYTLISKEEVTSEEEYFSNLQLKENGEPLSNDYSELGREMARFITPQTKDFWIDFENNRFYLLNTRSSQSGGKASSDFVLLEEFSYDDSSLRGGQYKVVRALPISVYSGWEILHFDKNRQAFVLKMGQGDGCGGGGSIYTLPLGSAVMKNIVSYGRGCAFDEKNPYRFGGMLNGRLILSEAELAKENFNGYISVDLKNIYLLDPFSLNKEVITDDKEILFGKDLDGWRASERSMFTEGIYLSGYTATQLQELNNNNLGTAELFQYDLLTNTLNQVAQ